MDEEEKKTDDHPSNLIQNTLLKGRKIVISAGVDSKAAERVVNQLLFLEEHDPDKDITVFINSPGGEVYSGFAIYDTMKLIKPRVKTVVLGLAASMGSIISLGGEAGHRYCTTNSKVLIHQPLITGVLFGSSSDIEIHTKDMLRLKEQIIRIYIEATGKDEKAIRHDLERDYWLTPTEAKDYGLVDKIIASTTEIE